MSGLLANKWLLPVLIFVAGSLFIGGFIRQKMAHAKAAAAAEEAKKQEMRDAGLDPDAPQPLAVKPVKKPKNAFFAPRYIRAVSGPLEGEAFEIYGQHFIGRDPYTCHIVFPKNTFGVSGKHCKVCLGDGYVTVTDNGSSFGCYYSNGAKMIPDKSAKIMPGDTFYLGNPSNTFEVV